MRLNIFLFVLTAAMLVFVVELVRRRALREKYAMLWLAVGGVMLALIIARPLVDRVAVAVGVEYGPTAIFALAVVFLAGVAAHLSYEVSRLEERTRLLAEELALLRPIPPRGVSDAADRSG